MSDEKIAVKVEGVSKTFRIPLEASSGIKQKIINLIKGRKGYREFTPLNDVSFEIKQGEFFGIVGRNGSGKSTLLKTIAGIYTPNKGGVAINGKLVPFIELGVGFNPELTGRENVFLNGALLGFSHKEMESMYDEIVDFAELHDFMEERLKNYSSGMQVRLAFSIAIKAEGDILLLDEILAVGDDAFQKKCFAYFNELKSSGKTVILVTHDMGAVERFCTKAILIKEGRIAMSGKPADIANQYLVENYSGSQTTGGIESDLGLSELVPRFEIRLLSEPVLSSVDQLELEVRYTVTQDIPVRFGISVIDQQGMVSVVDDQPRGNNNQLINTSVESGDYVYRYRLPLSMFNDRDYAVNAVLSRTDGDQPQNIAYTAGGRSCQFSIHDGGRDRGLTKIKGTWKDASEVNGSH